MTPELLYEKINALPSELKNQVEDFIDFLSEKQSKKISISKPKFGALKGKIIMSPDFDEPLEDFKDYM